MVFNSGEARGLVFWAVDPVWSPPQAPGIVFFCFSRSGSSERGRDLQKNGPFFSAFWEFRARQNPSEKLLLQ